MIHRLDSFILGQAWDEIATTFKFVEIDGLLDPGFAYFSLLALSVVVSLMSATYYFKIYELMAPPASTQEIGGQVQERVVHVLHDGYSITALVVLCILITVWIGSVT
jgi:NADH:ubiquinone oxidoreductase subunit 2 (subunit N)